MLWPINSLGVDIPNPSWFGGDVDLRVEPLIKMAADPNVGSHRRNKLPKPIKPSQAAGRPNELSRNQKSTEQSTGQLPGSARLRRFQNHVALHPTTLPVPLSTPPYPPNPHQHTPTDRNQSKPAPTSTPPSAGGLVRWSCFSNFCAPLSHPANPTPHPWPRWPLQPNTRRLTHTTRPTHRPQQHPLTNHTNHLHRWVGKGGSEGESVGQSAQKTRQSSTRAPSKTVSHPGSIQQINHHQQAHQRPLALDRTLLLRPWARPLPNPSSSNRRINQFTHGHSENRPPHKVTFGGGSCFRGGCATCEYWGGGECGLKFVGPQPRLVQRCSRLFIGRARRGVGALHRTHHPRSIGDAPPVQVGHLRLCRHLADSHQLPPRHRRHRFNIHFSDLNFQQTIISQQVFISPFFDTVAPSPGPGVRLVIGRTKTNVSSSARRNDRRRVHHKPPTNIRRIHA